MAPATAPERIPSLVSTASAAALLNVHPRTVRRLAETGRLSARQYGGFGKGLLFDLDEVLALVKSGYRGDYNDRER